MLDNYAQLVHQAMEHGANQREQELWIAGAILLQDRPRRLLEIGTASGGSFWFFKELATDDAEVMTVDITHHDLHDNNTPARASQQQLFYQGSCFDPATAVAALEFFSGSIDFLFIDAEHSYNAVTSDYNLYSPLVRSGGWIGFHDIVTPDNADGGVPRFWQEYKQTCAEHVEIDLENPEHGIAMGIGLARKA